MGNREPEAHQGLWTPPPQDRTVHSPLRYPGGKRRLVPYVCSVLAVNEQTPDLFVETFAGGASVALELASTGAVRQIGLVDRDPLVASFWRVAFFDGGWLQEQVESIEVDLTTWERFKTGRHRSHRQRALACLFLNRTSFNGALHRRAGPIGGKTQESEYDIGCRFPRDRLVSRLRALQELAEEDKVAFVRSEGALEAIGRVRREHHGAKLFFYLDPPFWAKSDRLYRFSFAVDDHRRLASALRYVKEPWLLSYDPAPEVLRLYEHHNARRAVIELLYTGSQRSAGEEIVVSNLERLPPDTRLWRTNAEWESLRVRPPLAPSAPIAEAADAGG